MRLKTTHETNLHAATVRKIIKCLVGVDSMHSDSDIIALAWDDKTSFEMIEDQTGLSEKDIIKLMRRSLKPGSFRKWRERVSGRSAKHAKRSLNALSIDDADLQ